MFSLPRAPLWGGAENYAKIHCRQYSARRPPRSGLYGPQESGTPRTSLPTRAPSIIRALPLPFPGASNRSNRGRARIDYGQRSMGGRESHLDLHGGESVNMGIAKIAGKLPVTRPVRNVTWCPLRASNLQWQRVSTVPAASSPAVRSR